MVGLPLVCLRFLFLELAFSHFSLAITPRVQYFCVQKVGTHSMVVVQYIDIAKIPFYYLTHIQKGLGYRFEMLVL